MLISIFTATYQGEHLLPKLFESFINQTNKNFEWILINDGSPDNTDEVVKTMQENANFTLRYFKKPNGGKTTAVNMGIQLAQGELWLIVDHDDFLSDDAIEVINRYYPKIKEDNDICSVTFLRHHHDGRPIGTQNNPNNLISDFSSYRTALNIVGDRAEVVKTDYFRKYCPIPTFENENNCLDGYIWLMLAKKYKTLFVANEKPIYYCEYLSTGRSLKAYDTPLGDMCIYNLYASMKQINIWQKFHTYGRYWCKFFTAKNISFRKAYGDLSHKWGLIALPLGILTFCLKKITIAASIRFNRNIIE